jgi:hypothetical protein
MYDSYVLEHQPNFTIGFIICVAIVTVTGLISQIVGIWNIYRVNMLLLTFGILFWHLFKHE